MRAKSTGKKSGRANQKNRIKTDTGSGSREKAVHSEDWSMIAIESAPFGVLVHDEKGNILIFNSQLEKICGYLNEEIPDLRTWISKLYPDQEYQKLVVNERKKKIAKDRLRIRKAIITRKDGRKRICQFSSILSSSGIRTVFIKDIQTLHETEESLRESEERFRILSEASFEGILIHKDGVVLQANEQFFDMFGYKAENLLGKQAIPILIAPESIPIIKKEIRDRTSTPYEVTGLKNDGTAFPILIRAKSMEYQGNAVRVAAIRDLSYDRRAESALLDSKKKLKTQARNLREVNTALKVLLEQREEEKAELKQNLLTNIKKTIYPYFEKIENKHLDEDMQLLINIIKSNLNDIISPLANPLSSKYLGLTPSEIQTADMIKQGKTSKEIALLLNISPQAVSFHRGNIRKKLGLHNKKINLRTYLQSFPQ